MHGEETTDHDHKHEGERHLWIAEARLRQAIKRTVANAGHSVVLQDPLVECVRPFDRKSS